MGADIHLLVQASPVRPSSSGYRHWRSIPKLDFTPSPDSWSGDFTIRPSSWYSIRNYHVFSMLADVRNTPRSGNPFIPVDSTWIESDGGDRILPIAEFLEIDAIQIDPWHGGESHVQRGFPDDYDPHEVRRDAPFGAMDIPDEGLHSATWFTLRELLDLEHLGYWDQAVARRGLVDDQATADAFDPSLGEGPKGGWFGGTNRGDAVEVQWEQTYRSMASGFIDAIEAVADWASSFHLQSFWSKNWKDNPPTNAPERPYFTPRPYMDHHVDVSEHIRFVMAFDS